MLRLLQLFILATVLLASTCEREVADPISDFGYEYFPLAIGMEWQYELDSIVLRQEVSGVVYDSVRLAAREVLLDTLTDLEGNTWYRGERYDRRIDSTDWRFRQTFLVRRNAQRAYRKEDNLEFVKLVFPPDENERWDGHAAFDQYREIEVAGQPISIYADWNYRYRTIADVDTFSTQDFTDLTVVEGADYENLINRRLSLEGYQLGKGLVYRELEVFETQCNLCCNGDTEQCLDLPWREKAEGGFIIRQWLVE